MAGPELGLACLSLGLLVEQRLQLATGCMLCLELGRCCFSLELQVRKVAYLGFKCAEVPLSALGLEQRLLVLRRGLADRSPAVVNVATSLLSRWLAECCGGEVLELLRHLAVEQRTGGRRGQIDCWWGSPRPCGGVSQASQLREAAEEARFGTVPSTTFLVARLQMWRRRQ